MKLSRQNKLLTNKDRWKERVKTYMIIAKAMAKQWSEYALFLPMNCQNVNAAENLGALFTWNTTPTATASGLAMLKI